MNARFAIAVHILVALNAAQKRLGGKPIPTSAIAWSAKTHNVFLLRIAKSLEKKGFIKTIRGKNGGLILNLPGEQISLADVYLATQESSDVYKVHDTNPNCRIGDNVRDVLQEIREKVNNELIEQLRRKTIDEVSFETLKLADTKVKQGKSYSSYKKDQKGD